MDYQQTDPEWVPSSAVLEFVVRYACDRDEGAALSLDKYLEMFPGDPEGVAREYRAMQRTGGWGAASVAVGSGDFIGSYRIVRELGRGAQGVVFLARDSRLDREVALKVLDPSVTGRARDAVKRLKREAEAVAGIDHPGICTLFEMGNDGDIWFLAMRYVEGETLAARMAHQGGFDFARGSSTCDDLDSHEDAGPVFPGGSGRRPGPQEIEGVLSFFEELARALHAAHEQGLIHRDIKPSNIMVTPDGRPVILDFGLARHLDPADDTVLTATGGFMGTPAYSSPEQFTGSSMALDQRADFYSFGACLFEALTGVRPFDGPTRWALQEAILNREPPGVRSLNAAVSRDAASVVAVCLDKDRNRRYESARDLAEDLRRVRAREPIRARPAGRLLRFRRLLQRHPIPASSLLLAFLSLTTALAVSLLLLAETDRARDDEREQRRLAEERTVGLRGLIEDIEGSYGDWQMRQDVDPATRLALGRAFIAATQSLQGGDPVEDARTLSSNWMAVGEALGGTGHNLLRHDEALEAFEQAEAAARAGLLESGGDRGLKSKLSLALVYKARLLRSRFENWDQARAALAEATRLTRENAEATNHRFAEMRLLSVVVEEWAHLDRDSERLEESLERFKALLSLKTRLQEAAPSSATVERDIVMITAQVGIGAGLAGRSAEGIEYLKKGAKLATERATRYPRHPNSWADVNFVCDALGRSLEKSGDREGACRAMERCAEACETVLRLRPDAPFRSRAKIAYTSVRNLAKARGDAESEERATLALARLDAGVPDASPGALLIYARRLLEVPEDRGRVVEALAVAKRAVKAAGSSEGLLVLALAYDAFGDEEAAVAALNKALARLAEEPDAVRRRLRRRIERRLELLSGRP